MKTTRTTLSTAAVLAAALALAACGTTAATTATSSGAAATQSAGTATWPTAAHVAAEIGATDVQAFTPTLYASDEADAVWHGRKVDIATFATTQLRDNWKQIASQFGAILLTGPLYVVADTGPAS